MKKRILKILFDINHPAHFHLFKNLIHYFSREDIPFLITTRNKEVTNALVEHEGFDYISLSNPAKTLPGLLWEMIKRDVAIYKIHKKEGFTHLYGTSASIAHLTAVSKVISYNFCEDDDDVIPLQSMIIYPFTTKIIIPDCLKYSRWNEKRIVVPSYHELAYLHPDVFEPDAMIAASYKLEPQKYVIIRLSALKAHHDLGKQGISQELLVKIKELLSDYTIIESSELKRKYSLKPWDMHHVMASAKMIISDSQTMSVEAMVLGVPSVRISSFVGKLSVLEELENNFGLGFGILPSSRREIFQTLIKLAGNSTTRQEWREKRDKMLKRKINMAQWMIDHFEEEIQGRIR